jgi:hypothetical protein
MVYERLPRKVKHSFFYGHGVKIVIVTRSMSLSILATCQEIRQEATHLVLAAAKKFILDRPVQIVSGDKSIFPQFMTMDVLKNICDIYARMAPIYAQQHTSGKNKFTRPPFSCLLM